MNMKQRQSKITRNGVKICKCMQLNFRCKRSVLFVMCYFFPLSHTHFALIVLRSFLYRTLLLMLYRGRSTRSMRIRYHCEFYAIKLTQWIFLAKIINTYTLPLLFTVCARAHSLIRSLFFSMMNFVYLK